MAVRRLRQGKTSGKKVVSHSFLEKGGWGIFTLEEKRGLSATHKLENSWEILKIPHCLNRARDTRAGAGTTS